MTPAFKWLLGWTKAGKSSSARSKAFEGVARGTRAGCVHRGQKAALGEQCVLTVVRKNAIYLHPLLRAEKRGHV